MSVMMMITRWRHRNRQVPGSDPEQSGSTAEDRKDTIYLPDVDGRSANLVCCFHLCGTLEPHPPT